ncbi:MAG TPA: DUF4837 family protein [Vicingaceae bacterium]|nr:DUF4837 family protein [Vicingaceae bacterium]
MKYQPLFLLLIILSTFFYACEETNERVLPRISGKSGNLLVVVDTGYWNHQTGEAIQNAFMQTQIGLPQQEPIFDVIHVPHRAFARILQTNRNILMVEINPQEKSAISIKKDVWSDGQIVATILAKNDKNAAEIIEKNTQNLIDYFNEKEIERLQKKYRVNSTSKLSKQLEEKLNLSMHVDDLFYIAKSDTNFLWLRKEFSVGEHPISQGFIIYTYPYDNDSIFDVKQLTLKRNTITKKHIPGGAEGSYMTTYEEYIPAEREINLKGNYCKELRGLWHIQGDFMGGPFVSYSLVDEKRNRVITIDGYVYAPNFDKREYLRELQALALTVSF